MIVPIYEDNHILVLNKPPGLLTQPSGTEQDSLEAQAKAWLKQKYDKKGNVFLEAAHRIDKAASGIVVFAKTSKAISRLNESIREGNIFRLYRAKVEGTMEFPEGTLEHYLIHDDYRATVVKKGSPEAKLARLNYRVVRQGKFMTLLEIVLETGRYHQIRAQFADIGHPIVGDLKYGSVREHVTIGIALHHTKFQIPHPTTKEMLTFESPPGW